MSKYHKNHYPLLQAKMDSMEESVDAFKKWGKKAKKTSVDFMQKLVGHEAQIAIHYWDYIRELMKDDDVGFERREHQGASDIVNSMLNYGYAILYTRVWQALLAAHLNPFDSLIHARQDGKPTLVYDMVEIFRSQVVDRVVISLVQTNQNLEVRNGLLTDQTRQLLVKFKMEQIIQKQAKQLAKAFDDIDAFKPYIAKW